MVTAKGEEIDRVVGFELGADDYVVKPFSTRELLLRVQAVLAPPGHAPPVPSAEGDGPIRFGCLLMDRERPPGLGGGRRGAAHRPRVQAARHPLRSARPGADPRLAARGRLGRQRGDGHPHRRHPRQAAAREAGHAPATTSRPCAASATASWPAPSDRGPASPGSAAGPGSGSARTG